MKQLLTYLLLFFLTITSSSAQTFKWVRGGGSTDDLSADNYQEEVLSMCTDYNGNVYALSVMGNGSMAADTFHRSSAYGVSRNIMFTSHNCSGQMRFAKLIASSVGQCIPFSVVADNIGHVYVAGYLTNNTLHVGYDTTIGFFYQDQAVIQYDTSGEFNWIRYTGNSTPATFAGADGGFLAVDGANNVHFINSLRYGVAITPSLTSHRGAYDLAYDASGSLLSVKKLALDSTLYLRGGVINKTNNKLYVRGHRFVSMFPDSSSYNFIAAFDVNRNVVWIDTITTFHTETEDFSGITTDNAGHLYFSLGTGQGFVYHGDTIKNVISAINPVTAVMKTDTNANLSWVTPFSGTLAINGLTNIVMMPNNKLAVGGNFAGTVSSGSNSITLYTGEGWNADFAILDSGGYVHTLQQLHGPGFFDGINCLASDREGNLYLGGRVESSIWAGSLPPYASVGGNSDFFIMKYGVDCACTYMPVANYTVSGGITKSFTYTGTMVGVDSVKWSFGDGVTALGLTASHTYTYADTFTACVTVYTNCGSDMHCSDFVIICVAAPASAYTSTGTGLTKSFTYSGTTTAVSSISWNFGDASAPGTGTSPTHTYASPGTYTVCVTATNPCGSNTYCHSIIACASAITASYTQTVTGLSSSFTYTGTTASVDSVVWDFGDGHKDTGITATHTYATADTYHVCVTAYTNCGNEVHCTDIIVTSTAVIAVHSLGDIKVYPNPSRNELYINDVPQETGYRLLSMMGVKLQQGILYKGDNMLLLSDMASGIYIIEMTGSDGQKNVVRVMKE